MAFFFGLVQTVTAMGVMGKIKMPGWVSPVHRWSGRIAVALTVPVAVHCLYALGFQGYSVRVLRALPARLLLLRRLHLQDVDLDPGRLAELGAAVMGGAVFSGLTALWMTAALWFFTTPRLTF